MKRPVLTGKVNYYTIELSEVEAGHLEEYVENETSLNIWSKVDGVQHGSLLSLRFYYSVSASKDRPEIHEAVYANLKGILDAQMSFYYEDLFTLPEKARDIAVDFEPEGDDGINLVATFIAAGGAQGRDVDEAMSEFLTKLKDDGADMIKAFVAAGGQRGRDVDAAIVGFMTKLKMVGGASLLAYFDPILQAQAMEAGWDNSKIVESLMRFIEAGGPMTPDDWRYEVQQHVRSEIAAKQGLETTSGPKL